MARISPWLAGGIIALFAISMFATLLYVPTPQEATPSPSPTSEPQGTAAQGRATANVVSLSNQILVQCNASDTDKMIKVLDGVKGVQDAFLITTDLYSASLNASIASNHSASFAAIMAANSALSPFCVVRALRKGAASFDGPVSLLSQEGNSTRNVSVYSRELDAFAYAVGSPNGVPVYFIASAQANESVEVAIVAQFDAAGRLSQWFAQQVSQDVPHVMEGVSVQGLIRQIAPAADVKMFVSWQQRGLDSAKLNAELNSSVYLSLISFSYSPSDFVLVKNFSLLGVNESNATLQLLKGQPFVLDAVQREGDLQVSVSPNFTDAAGFRKLFAAKASSLQLEFPNSTVFAAFSFQNSTLEQAALDVRAVLGQSAQVFPRGLVELADAAGESARLGFALPFAVPASLNENASVNQTGNFSLSLLVQGENVLQALARQE